MKVLGFDSRCRAFGPKLSYGCWMLAQWLKPVLDREGSMAGTKAKPTQVIRRARSTIASKRPNQRQTIEVVAPTADANRLLREAAWSQMFGRVEAKNPFTQPT